MARVLTFSSQVVCGYIGNSITTFILQRLGHEVYSIPSVLLSHHAGHKDFTSQALDTGFIERIIEMMGLNNQLSTIDAILTGYMPSEEHVILARKIIMKVRSENPNVTVLCDPILGDYPNGLYIDGEIASKIKSKLIPLADIITPNYFEFGWLSGDEKMSLEQCQEAAKGFDNYAIIVTSFQSHDHNSLDNLLFLQNNVFYTSVPKYNPVAKGTGDLFAALFLAHKLSGAENNQALGLATNGVAVTLKESQNSDYLKIIEAQDYLSQKVSWPVHSIK